MNGPASAMRVAGAILILLLRSLPMQAQTVRGIVVEEGSDAPIGGVMVILLDTAGQVAARTLSDDAGHFAVEVPQPGRYRARIDRIGYESLTTDPFDVPPDGMFRRIRVPVHPVELRGLDVSGSERCRLHADVGKATVTVWEEARKALEAAAWTVESGWYRYTLLRFERHLDRDGSKVLSGDLRFVKSYAQAPYGSRPAEQLADSGYLRNPPDGKPTYFAPDAEVLLSGAFVSTHCMRVQPGKDGLVGLAFEPVNGRKVPDIRGVLWLDEATGMLERLDFRYVHLPWGGTGDAGGEVTFGRLPAGTWIVRDWYIRMPLLVLRRGGWYDRAGYEEAGGVVWRAIDRSGAVVWKAPEATVSGDVTDSLGKKPVPGAVIAVRGLGIRASSDSAGAFVLSGLPGGRLTLDVTDPSLDTLGLAGSKSVDVAWGGASHARVRVPGIHSVLARACARGAEGNRPTQPKGTVIVLGRVRDRGRAAAGATVQLVWLSTPVRQRLAGTPAAPPLNFGGAGEAAEWKLVQLRGRSWLEATLDQRGTFLVCDVPPSYYRVTAAAGDRSAEVTVPVPGRNPVKIVTVTLEAGRRQQASGLVHGRVLDAESGEPVTSANVSIVEQDSVALATSSTDSDGRYRLPVLESGTFRIRAEQLGYRTTLSDPTPLSPHDTVEVDLRLSPAPLLLDSILVSVSEAGRRLRAGEQLVYGRLLDDGTHGPISGGTLQLLTKSGDVAATATSSGRGQFWLVSPRAGTYRLRGEHVGYKTAESPALYLMLGDSIGMDFYLSTRAALVAPMTVTASRRAWSDRAELGGMEGFLSRYGRFTSSGYGQFMTRDSIAYWDQRGVTVGDMLLAKIHAVTGVVPLGDSMGGAVIMTGGQVSISAHIGPGGCIPRYYLDGSLVPYTALSGLTPADLEGVEVYVWPQIPAEFSMGYPCGVVVYWSRRSPRRFGNHATIWTVLLIAAVVTGAIVFWR